jgi:hypothetical protein
MTGLGDINGDGYDDFAIGSPYHHADSDDEGGLFVFLGPLSGATDLDDADGSHVGDSSDEKVGFAVRAQADLDGDGTDDVAVGAPLDEAGAEYGGVVYVLTSGLATHTNIADTATATLVGEYDDVFGGALDIGDANGDGQADLLVGAGMGSASSNSISTSSGNGGAWLFAGPLSGTLDTSDATTEFAHSSSSYFGVEVGFVGDQLGTGSESIGVTNSPHSGDASLYMFMAPSY